MVYGSTGLAHDYGRLAPSDGPTLCMFRANASPGLGPSRYGGGHHGLRGWRRALKEAAARTTPADRAGMATRANMPAWRMGHEAA